VPLYEYECNSCERRWEAIAPVEERYSSPCPSCGHKPPTILIGGNKQQTKLFPEGWFRDIAYDPIYITSRRQLREECKKHECYAKYDDGYAGF